MRPTNLERISDCRRTIIAIILRLCCDLSVQIVMSEIEREESVYTGESSCIELSQAVVTKVKVNECLMEFTESVINDTVDGVVRNIESFQTY